MKRFEESDIFVNTIKTHPKVSLFCYDGRILLNNTTEQTLKLNNFLIIPEGLINPPLLLITEAGLFLTTEDDNNITTE